MRYILSNSFYEDHLLYDYVDVEAFDDVNVLYEKVQEILESENDSNEMPDDFEKQLNQHIDSNELYTIYYDTSDFDEGYIEIGTVETFIDTIKTRHQNRLEIDLAIFEPFVKQ